MMRDFTNMDKVRRARIEAAADNAHKKYWSITCTVCGEKFSAPLSSTLREVFDLHGSEAIENGCGEA